MKIYVLGLAKVKKVEQAVAVGTVTIQKANVLVNVVTVNRVKVNQNVYQKQERPHLEQVVVRKQSQMQLKEKEK